MLVCLSHKIADYWLADSYLSGRFTQAEPLFDQVVGFCLFFYVVFCHKKLHLIGWIYRPIFEVQFNPQTFFFSERTISNSISDYLTTKLPDS